MDCFSTFARLIPFNNRSKHRESSGHHVADSNHNSRQFNRTLTEAITTVLAKIVTIQSQNVTKHNVNTWTSWCRAGIGLQGF